MREILIDSRWSKAGGIGTFSEQINRINHYRDAGFSGKPFNPFDCIKTSIKLIKKQERVIFFPGYIPPLFSFEPYVFTIHDLNHLDRHENSSFFKRIFYKYVILSGCRKAKFIFTVSDFSKNRIVNWAGVSEDKVINVSNGVSEVFTPIGDKLDFTYEYFLCVSNRKEHKNEFGTLESFKKANFSENIKLIFTGCENESIRNKINELDLNDRVSFTGFIDSDSLPKLYRGARALVFVSFYEGFGLPVIEAMASGIPVITSNNTSLVEVAGDAALLVDPTKIDDIADAMVRINTDEALRKKKVELGFEQARKFSWEETARKVRYYLEGI